MNNLIIKYFAILDEGKPLMFNDEQVSKEKIYKFLDDLNNYIVDLTEVNDTMNLNEYKTSLQTKETYSGMYDKFPEFENVVEFLVASYYLDYDSASLFIYDLIDIEKTSSSKDLLIQLLKNSII